MNDCVLTKMLETSIFFFLEVKVQVLQQRFSNSRNMQFSGISNVVAVCFNFN